MFVINFISKVDDKTLAAVEGPFDDQDLAMDYLDQRDHMPDTHFRPVIVPLTRPRFAPDTSYRTAA